jgi:hypothetical protein
MSEATAAYGFRFAGLESHRWLGVSGGGHWPCVTCRRDGSADAPDLVLDTDGLELRTRADIPHSELVHPLLGRVASRLALARGADGMHAGAVAGPGGAWAVVGPKMAGKSTLLAALAEAGTPIVTDDVLVFSNGTAMAGPRCVDLRPDAPHSGFSVAVRPGDPRLRIPLPPIAAEHRLAGVIHLEWDDGAPTLARLDHREALKRLLSVRSEKGYPRDPRCLLDLAALPTLRLRRARETGAMPASVALIQRLLEDPDRAAGGHAPDIAAAAETGDRRRRY